MLGEDAWKTYVVGLAQGKGNDLQEESKQMDLPLFYLADAGYAIYLLEVQNRIDVEIVILLLHFVHREVSLSSD